MDMDTIDLSQFTPIQALDYVDRDISQTRANTEHSLAPYLAIIRRSLEQAMPLDVNALAQEIRRVDGNHSLGAGALAKALMPFLCRVRTGGTPRSLVAAAQALCDLLPKGEHLAYFHARDRLLRLRALLDDFALLEDAEAAGGAPVAEIHGIIGSSPRDDLVDHPVIAAHRPKVGSSEVSLQQDDDTNVVQWNVRSPGGVWRPCGPRFVLPAKIAIRTRLWHENRALRQKVDELKDILVNLADAVLDDDSSRDVCKTLARQANKMVDGDGGTSSATQHHCRNCEGVQPETCPFNKPSEQAKLTQNDLERILGLAEALEAEQGTLCADDARLVDKIKILAAGDPDAGVRSQGQA